MEPEGRVVARDRKWSRTLLRGVKLRIGGRLGRERIAFESLRMRTSAALWGTRGDSCTEVSGGAKRLHAAKPKMEPGAEQGLNLIWPVQCPQTKKVTIDLHIKKDCATWKADKYKKLLEQFTDGLGHVAAEPADGQQPVASSSSQSTPASATPSGQLLAPTSQHWQPCQPSLMAQQDNNGMNTGEVTGCSRGSHMSKQLINVFLQIPDNVTSKKYNISYVE
ncbi:hypothetical protein EDB85DRAFT_1903124 [Lactarius pseudohatsudake]|nr:hypothetical protein EDB85DRAFT_1903124 [Lactarius pseudohatsudake]